MNGSVTPMLEKPKEDKIRDQCAALIKTFYDGDPLTDLETDIERMYINEKLEKQKNYQSRKSFRYKVRWTYSDFNRYQDHSNYKMNSPEYFGHTKPRFIPFDLDKALENMYIHQDIQRTSQLRRMLTYFTDTKTFERG